MPVPGLAWVGVEGEGAFPLPLGYWPPCSPEVWSRCQGSKDAVSRCSARSEARTNDLDTVPKVSETAICYCCRMSFSFDPIADVAALAALLAMLVEQARRWHSLKKASW